jgi:transcriptional regulator GlxA family with amidase domain
LIRACIIIIIIMANEAPITKYAVALFPGFQALDVFGPVDIINQLAKSTNLELVILAASLDPVSTAVTEGGVGQLIVPTHTYDNAPDDIQVLLVPGGLGTRDEANISHVIKYVQTVYPKLRYLLTVCTGSALVAMSGVIDGKRATGNKRAWKWAITKGPNVDWVLKARWVADGNIWTSSGISAGIDMMYAFMAELYGEDVAQELADSAEYRRNTDPDDDPFVGSA